MRLNAQLDRLWIGADTMIDGAEIYADYDGKTWQLVTASGRMSGDSRIEAHIVKISAVSYFP